MYDHTNHIKLLMTSQVPTPEISISGGVKNNDISVTITCSLTGSNIYYTTDGSTPDEGDTLYTGAIAISTDTVLKARAYKSGHTASEVAQEVYTFVVATPVVSPSSGRYPATQTVTITCATTGATIYYTLDGSEPDTGSTEYTATFDLSADTVIRFYAVKSGYSDSGKYRVSLDIDLNYFMVSGMKFVTSDGEYFLVQFE